MHFTIKITLLSYFTCLALAQVNLQSVYTNVENTSTKAIFPPIAAPAMPVLNAQSQGLICRTSNLKYTDSPLTVSAGSQLHLTWAAGMSPITNKPLLGPCTVYFSSVKDNPASASWFKIYERGYVANKWCSEAALSGPFTMVIPQNITAGDYRMRVEVIDLRNAATNGNLDPSMGPHFYVNCAMLTVTGASNGAGTVKPSLVAIGSVYKNPKGLSIDGSNPGQAASFKIPGPSAYPSS